MKCGPDCTRVKVGMSVAFTPGVMPPRFIEKHFCGKPVANKKGTIVLRPMPACRDLGRPLNPAGASEPGLHVRRGRICGEPVEPGAYPCQRKPGHGLPHAAGVALACGLDHADAKAAPSEPARPLSVDGWSVEADDMGRIPEVYRVVSHERRREWARRNTTARVPYLATVYDRVIADRIARLPALEADLAAAREEIAIMAGGREENAKELLAEMGVTEALRKKLAEAERVVGQKDIALDTLGNMVGAARREATARVRDMREACANKARRYITEMHGPGLGDSVAILLLALPGDAGSALRTCGKEVPGGRNCGDTTVATGRPITIICGRCRVGRPPLPDDAGAATVTMLDVHEDPVTGEPLFTPATAADGEAAKHDGDCALAAYGICTCPRVRVFIQAGAIAAAVAAAYKRAADAFGAWYYRRIESGKRAGEPNFGRSGLEEFEAYLRAGCPAPGEAPTKRVPVCDFCGGGEAVNLFAKPPRDGACRGCGRLRGADVGRDGFCADCRATRNGIIYSQGSRCRGCSTLLAMENFRVADGCPCNSARGINHGLVPILTCTCAECDPEQTGSTRAAAPVVAEEKGTP